MYIYLHKYIYRCVHATVWADTAAVIMSERCVCVLVCVCVCVGGGGGCWVGDKGICTPPSADTGFFNFYLFLCTAAGADSAPVILSER